MASKILMSLTDPIVWNEVSQLIETLSLNEIGNDLTWLSEIKGIRWDKEACWGLCMSSTLPTRCQFHQHFTRAFFCSNVFFGSFSLVTFGLAPKFLCKKCICITLMKLNGGENVINWLQVKLYVVKLKSIISSLSHLG